MNIDTRVVDSKIQNLTVGGVVHNHYDSTPASTEHLSEADLQLLEADFKEHFAANVLKHYATIPIPASKRHAKLSDTVLNLKAVCINDESDSDSESKSKQPKIVKEGSAQIEPDSTHNVLPGGYESDSDSDSNCDARGNKTSFHSLCCAIESEKENDNNLFHVCAPGGRGKTTTSKKIMWHWAAKEYLRCFSLVVVIDLKKVTCEKSVFANLLKQYSFIEGKYARQVANLSDMLREAQSRILWMLDGLDECTNHAGMYKFLKSTIDHYYKSSFIVLSRAEGKEILRDIRDSMVEYSLDMLDEDQCQQFIDRFPFSGKNRKDRQAKRAMLRDQLKINSAMQLSFAIPINAVMVCRLFDEKRFDGHVRNEIDLLFKLMSLIIKAALIKFVDQRLELCKTPDKQELLSTDRDELMEKDIKEILSEKEELLVNVGLAIFICNGFSLVGFQDVPEKEFKERLRELNLSDDDMSIILKLDIFDKYYEGDEVMLHFYHRSIREFLVSLALVKGEKVLTPKENCILKDAHISVLKCAIALILEEGTIDLENKLLSVIRHILLSCSNADQWRLLEIVITLMHVVTHRPELTSVLEKVLLNVIKLVDERSLPFNQNLRESIDGGFLHVIANHSGNCHVCPPLDKFGSFVRKMFEQNRSPTYLWPESKSFAVFPFMAKNEDYICMILPDTGRARHVLHGTTPFIWAKKVSTHNVGHVLHGTTPLIWAYAENVTLHSEGTSAEREEEGRWMEEEEKRGLEEEKRKNEEESKNCIIS